MPQRFRRAHLLPIAVAAALASCAPSEPPKPPPADDRVKALADSPISVSG